MIRTLVGISLRCGPFPRQAYVLQGVRSLASLARNDEQKLPTLQRVEEIKRVRNIGIIAHIDAGKTTTTERMLYYSGYTRRIGDVDEGSTVTDFLPAERARGITIQSAAITFQWPPFPVQHSQSTQDSRPPELKSSIPHTINLIDTPGHADFTFEVLRSLRVLDGAICILDGVAGVEAQTEKVCRQADVYNIPRIIYINKLDRDGAAFHRTVKEIGTRLMQWPAICHIPWWQGATARFVGLGDVIGLRGLRWEDDGDGRAITAVSLQELHAVNTVFAEELKKARIALVELLSEHDDGMVEKYLEHDEDHLAIPASDILSALRNCLRSQSRAIVPVFAGASFRNIGVQPLLDAVADLLPDPTERPDVRVEVGSNALRATDDPGTGSPKTLRSADKDVVPSNIPMGALELPESSAAFKVEGCALAFKVVSDARRGVLVYVRVYSGVVQRNAMLYNTNLQVPEKAHRLLRMYAADAEEVSEISAGHIGVITGLNHARTGDTLVSFSGVNSKKGPPAPWNDLRLQAINVPPPVFFASIVPHSRSEEKNLQDALTLLLREDPSLNLSVDEESGQTLLSGMGELHLEIARDRLVQDLKAKAEIGDIEIGYRECLLDTSDSVHHTFDSDIAGRRGKAACEVQVQPIPELYHDNADLAAQDEGLDDATHTVQRDGNIIKIYIDGLDKTSRAPNFTRSLFPTHLSLSSVTSSLTNGALGGLVRGPVHSYPMHNTHVTINLSPAKDIFGPDSTPGAIASAARQATRAALKAAAAKSGTGLMEPVMKVTISTDEASLGPVVHDISSARGGHVLSLDGAIDDDDDDDDTATSSSSSSSPACPNTANSHFGAYRHEDVRPIDPAKIYAPPDPFGASNSGGGRDDNSGNENSPARARTIQARVPLREMVGYLKRLRSLTAGRGSFVMSVDRFEKMSAVTQRKVLAALRGDM